MDRQREPDPTSSVVVPARPGPVVHLDRVVRRRDEVDELIDDVFGSPDDRGPGVVDAVLVGGGLAGLIAGLTGAAPTLVTVLGASVLALGSVLPIRAVAGRLSTSRRDRQLRALVGDGTLLRTDHQVVRALLDADERVSAAAERSTPVLAVRARTVAHAALHEVASLLDGRRPVTDAEAEYIAARATALHELADALVDPDAAEGGAARRRAMVEARHEVERVSGGSSVTDAAQLREELLGGGA